MSRLIDARAGCREAARRRRRDSGPVSGSREALHALCESGTPGRVAARVSGDSPRTRAGRDPVGGPVAGPSRRHRGAEDREAACDRANQGARGGGKARALGLEVACRAGPDAHRGPAMAKGARRHGELPPEAFTNTPELFADLFVCQVETRDWTGAEASKPRIPPALLGRADVERAARSLEAERGRRTPP